MGRSLTVNVDGVDRRARIHVPDPMPDDPLPLVLAFHGYSLSFEDQETRSGLSPIADREGFVVAYPQALGDPTSWDLAGDGDVAFVRELLAAFDATGCIDATRIYATGFSMGGGLTDVVGCRLADRFAAIAPVSGVYGPSWGGACVPTRAVPVISFHGERDGLVRFLGGEPSPGKKSTPIEEWAAAWAERNGCDPAPVEQPAIGDVDPEFWTNCDAPVELYRVTDGGHTWPGGINDSFDGITTTAISASELMWTFFAANPMVNP